MYPLSDVGCDSNAPNVKCDVVSEISRHPEPGSADARQVARISRDRGFEFHDSSLDVGSDMRSSVEQVMTIDDINQEETSILASFRRSYLPPVATTSLEGYAMSQSDTEFEL